MDSHAGDICENVISLRKRDRATILDENSRKAKDLITLGEDRQVVEIFEELRESVGSVSSVEKAHGSGACLAKDHTYIAEV